MPRALVRSLRTLLVVAVLVLWTSPNKANAWGWGRGGGGGGGFSYYGYAGQNYPGRYGWYGWPYYSFGYPNYYSPYYYGSYSSYPVVASESSSTPAATTSFSSPLSAVSYYDVVPSDKSEYMSTTGKTDPNDTKGHITIVVPDADAQVMVNGKKTSATGTERYFQTPDLKEPGNYSYEVKASWRSNGETVTKNYTVKVKAGAQSLVDFTR